VTEAVCGARMNPADEFIETLAAMRSVDFRTFLVLFDHYISNAGTRADESAYMRSRDLYIRALHRLAYVDIERPPWRAHISPTALVRLAPSSQVVALVGARDSDLCRRFGTVACELELAHKKSVETWQSMPLPTRMWVSCSCDEKLGEFARLLGVPITPIEVSSQFLKLCPSLDEFLAGLDFGADNRSVATASDLDPMTLRFSGWAPVNQERPLALRTYDRRVYPDSVCSLLRWNRLYERVERAAVELGWGLFAVASAQLDLIWYDQRRHSLLIPLHAHLPLVLQRALALASARKQGVVIGYDCGVKGGLSREKHIQYVGIPLALAQQVAARLGQTVEVVT